MEWRTVRVAIKVVKKLHALKKEECRQISRLKMYRVCEILYADFLRIYDITTHSPDDVTRSVTHARSASVAASYERCSSR